MNRLYEGMFLLDANETAKRWNEMETQINSLLGRIGGEIQYAERWPTQKLAYEVKGVRKGTYYLTYFTAPPEKVAELRRDAELSEDILRLMVIQEEWLEQEMNNRKEAASRRGDEPEAPAEEAAPPAASAEPEPAPAPAESTEAPADPAPSAEEASADAGAEEAKAE